MDEHAKIATVHYFPSEGKDTPPIAMAAHASTSTADLTTWHRRLGHLHADAVSLMQAKGMITGMEITKGILPTPCELCLKGETNPRRNPNKTPDTRADVVLGRMNTRKLRVLCLRGSTTI